jgi:D-glycero-D-manno-heptose 1,7-bisphosphate phosphatase
MMIEKRVLYLDLDGTVMYGFDDLGYNVHTPEQVVFYPGVIDLMHHYKRSGYFIAGVSNQGGIAMGYCQETGIAAVCAKVIELSRGLFDVITYCRHHPEAKDPGDAQCFCRKPRYGMLVTSQHRLMDLHGGKYFYPPHLALMVGDREEDKQCAANAGVLFRPASEWRAEKVGRNSAALKN